MGNRKSRIKKKADTEKADNEKADNEKADTKKEDTDTNKLYIFLYNRLKGETQQQENPDQIFLI